MLTNYDSLFSGCVLTYSPKGNSNSQYKITATMQGYTISYLIDAFKRLGYNLIKIEVPENHILRTWKDG